MQDWAPLPMSTRLALTGEQQAEIIATMCTFTKKQNNVEMVRYFFGLDGKEQQRCLQFAAKQVHAQAPVVSKWFFKVYSQCAFAPLEPRKVEILRLIIAMIPGYAHEGSLTTFVRDRLLHFQEEHNLHPGKFYDYVYQMCGKFTKAKN